MTTGRTDAALARAWSDPSEPSRWPAAALLALVVEGALLAGALWMAQRPAPQPAQPMQIVLNDPAPKPLAPPPPKPQPKPQPRHAQPKPVVPPPPQPRIVTPPAPVATTHPSMPVTPPPPPPPREAPRTPDLGALKDSFAAELHSAIQSAVRYPAAARMMHLAGKTRVAFDWVDGRVANPRVIASSGSDQLDAAALAAVRDAFYPPTPPELQGRALAFQITVRFDVPSDE